MSNQSAASVPDTEGWRSTVQSIWDMTTALTTDSPSKPAPKPDPKPKPTDPRDGGQKQTRRLQTHDVSSNDQSSGFSARRSYMIFNDLGSKPTSNVDEPMFPTVDTVASSSLEPEGHTQQSSSDGHVSRW